MRAIPRGFFVLEDDHLHAYEDHPLPIGFGQTISQPSLVGLMTELLNAKKDHWVLEIGTGSGYQAAILSRLVNHVYFSRSFLNWPVQRPIGWPNWDF